MLTRDGRHVCAGCEKPLKNYEYYDYECSTCSDYEQEIRERFLELLEKYRDTIDWQGKPILKEEKPYDNILVWKVSPHPLYPHKYDYILERSYLNVLSYLDSTMDNFLEGHTEEELREGVTLTFKLQQMSLLNYLEFLEENEYN